MLAELNALLSWRKFCLPRTQFIFLMHARLGLGARRCQITRGKFVPAVMVT